MIVFSPQSSNLDVEAMLGRLGLSCITIKGDFIYNNVVNIAE